MAKSIVISDKAHALLKKVSGNYSIKDYTEFLITYASVLEIPYQDFAASDLTNKELESSLLKRLTSRHNTVIGFIKAQDETIAAYFENLRVRDEHTLRMLIDHMNKTKI